MVKKALLICILYFVCFQFSSAIYIPECNNCPPKKYPTFSMILEDIVFYEYGPKSLPEKRINPLLYIAIFNIIIIFILIFIRKRQLKGNK